MPTMTRRRFLNGLAVTLGAAAGAGETGGLRALAAQPMIIKLEKDYGYESFRAVDLPAGAVIDASEASWIVANSRGDPAEEGCRTGSLPDNRYPFQVRRSRGVKVMSGSIWGVVPQEADWTHVYRDIRTGESCNSAAMRFSDCPGVVVDGWRIARCWDGIRIARGSSDWLVRGCWLSDVRDDAIENDYFNGGVIEDCLFDGVFVGISAAPGSGNTGLDGSENEIVMDGMLLRLKRFNQDGLQQHKAPFKMGGPVELAPKLRIRNCVIAIEDVNHSTSRLQRAWDRTVESSQNYYLNLSDDPLPRNYPATFGALGGGDWVGFTLLQGYSARDHWKKARLKWLAKRKQ